MKNIIVALALHLLVIPAQADVSSPWKLMLDAELSQWDVWIGVPHSSVKGLPEGTYQSDNVHAGEALGLNKDIKKVFSVVKQDDELVLAITGEIYGGLTTKKSYSNYHLQTKMKWGEKKWEPRTKIKRDSGILYHCHGKHGDFWNTWMSCLEFQVQEKDMGDFIPLAGPSAMVRLSKDEAGKGKFDATSSTYVKSSGYTKAKLEPDFENGKWNTLDVYVIGGSAIHVVNGVVVLALKDAVDKANNPLTSGLIQIQSEAAECYYKELKIRPLKEFPSAVKAEAGL